MSLKPRQMLCAMAGLVIFQRHIEILEIYGVWKGGWFLAPDPWDSRCGVRLLIPGIAGVGRGAGHHDDLDQTAP